MSLSPEDYSLPILLIQLVVQLVVLITDERVGQLSDYAYN